ncbi:inorganic diphosphatase [Ohtaekwangia koreensis]|uniref:Inorganic pyrophosphatase n=1 Tax=Ohtaekwangia koreensis TaxID=688867 RepID=A0A1T5K945_9BACT|nr:inorganic diphosphatase [Ohtaekwangia koreensis]SKC60154.1 inorganic pyrophosphatase [Ohtaekwangia koreensis]
MIKHPWHEVATGLNPPEQINAIIEIPKGSRAKYEIDKDSGLIKLDRVIYASMYYPLNYGFIPQTLGEDHDPLDIVVLTQVAVVPGCLIPSKVIGVMQMIDRGEADDKIIAVAEEDPSVSHISDVKDLPDYLLAELKHFFENYKSLENKKVIVDEFLSKPKAEEIIKASIERYHKEFKK